MITFCPKKEYAEEVSKVINPVTHTALVEVKNASIKETGFSPEAAGSMRSKVPKQIVTKKLRTNTLDGCI